MIIKSLAHYKNDIELVWLSGHYTDHSQKRHLSVRFRDLSNSNYFQETLPFAYLPFLMPGLVVSRGEVQIARVTGQSGRANLSDLSDAEEIDVGDAVPPSLYSFGHHRGGGQRILRYRSGGKAVLIPTIEMIRFLFLHSRVLADALMVPSGLQNLALTPKPGLMREVEIGFENSMPRRLLTEDFIREFVWLSVHPDGRRAWDSVRRRSQGQRFLTLTPPSIANCALGFRGVETNGHCLVLELTSLSGREQPARSIVWWHSSVREPSKIGSSVNKGTISTHQSSEEGRPGHERDYVVDGEAERQNNVNQDAIFLGGKRGRFQNTSIVTKNLLPAKAQNTERNPAQSRKSRLDAGQSIDSDLPPAIIRKQVSAGSTAISGGMPPVEFLMLDQAGDEHLGDLGLLKKVLHHVEELRPDLTLTLRLLFLKPGRAISYVGDRRRACLMAVFSINDHVANVILDVDHTGLRGGLSGLLLSYETPISMDKIAGQIQQIMKNMVNNHGHWEGLNEGHLFPNASVTRLSKLMRLLDRMNDQSYVHGWAIRLSGMLYNTG